MADGTAPTPEAPEAVAIRENFWTLTIRALDEILDALKVRADLFAESQFGADARDLREAAAVIQAVRDKRLAENYDANRKGEGVRR